jgi:hypothetical protein
MVVHLLLEELQLHPLLLLCKLLPPLDLRLC